MTAVEPGSGSDAGPETGSDAGPDAALRERLDAVIRDLAAPPWDRDPVLWAAHEMARSAQALVAARTEGSDLADALEYTRSAMLCLRYAVRDGADATR